MKEQCLLFHALQMAGRLQRFNSSQMDIYVELATADGAVTGYIKSIIMTDINVVSIEQDRNFCNLVCEAFASLFVELFQKNHSRDRFAMRIPVEGQQDDPEQEFWCRSGFFSIFANAFGTAFPRNPDGTIDFHDAPLEEN